MNEKIVTRFRPSGTPEQEGKRQQATQQQQITKKERAWTAQMRPYRLHDMSTNFPALRSRIPQCRTQSGSCQHPEDIVSGHKSIRKPKKKNRLLAKQDLPLAQRLLLPCRRLPPHCMHRLLR
uniref:Uncharacterized protein n=1 Tax=Palpitomonas bilix TaxID=652834 RepID=A0A7S3D136_9EUKA|mmetsp:Transcript_17850/g.44256  ORF Transcript_17850/g.44256 Transcript_17850/m.44256 type:complete len:122 (+) Transcript_17850:365-730(+)